MSSPTELENGFGRAAESWSMDRFIRNAWYLGAYSSEVTSEKPFQRTVIDEPLVFFRTESGHAAALKDMCPHRFAPLSTGRVMGESIECGYHGFTFNGSGACTRVPGMAEPPASLQVPSYPLIEKWGLVFVWLGDPTLAREDLLPPLGHFDDADWTGDRDLLHVDANYALIRDNLLDLTHAKFLHGSTLATDDVTEFPVDADIEDGTLHVRRSMVNIARTGPFITKHGGFTDRVTHLQDIQFTPPYTIVIDVRVFSSDESAENKRAEFRVLNALVPETSRSTHYFWSLKRNFDRDNEQRTREMHAGNASAFQEDKGMIEVQQKMIERYRPDHSHAGPHDRGILMAHKMVRDLIKSELENARQAAE